MSPPFGSLTVLTTSEIVEYLAARHNIKRTRDAVWRACVQGRLRHAMRIGRDWVASCEEVEEWAEKLNARRARARARKKAV